MTIAPDILARGDEGIIQVVVIAVIIAISAISGLVKKAMQKREEEEALRNRPPRPPPARPARQAPEEEDVFHPTGLRAGPQQTVRQVQRPAIGGRPAASQTIGRGGSTIGYVHASAPPPLPRAPARVPQPLRPAAGALPSARPPRGQLRPAAKGGGVPRRAAGVRDETDRMSKMAASTMGAAMGRRPIDAQPGAAALSEIAQQMTDPIEITKAIIYLEILSPPKALRDAVDSWEI